MKGRTPVVRVGCQIIESVYQKINVGSLLVSVGSTKLVPFAFTTVTSMNFGMFSEKDRNVKGKT